MKKALALLLAMIMVIGMLAGCGTTGGGDDEGRDVNDTKGTPLHSLVSLSQKINRVRARFFSLYHHLILL